jgi:hypothetical protein
MKMKMSLKSFVIFQKIILPILFSKATPQSSKQFSKNVIPNHNESALTVDLYLTETQQLTSLPNSLNQQNLQMPE